MVRIDKTVASKLFRQVLNTRVSLVFHVEWN